ncbi:MAG: 50S ribosomal protein L4 [Sedimentisphaerales bacterium]|nr:50S ribosomal protein L4 [Sedimentisphaerales bacterium]
MIDLTVYNIQGKEVESLKIDKEALGGSIRYPLLKQAIVMYHANKHLGTAANKGRSMVAGSDKKLFKQKGTGNARVGNKRTGKRVGGGVTFAKTMRDFGKQMPKKQKKLARDSAILAKLLKNNIVVVDELRFEKPRTRDFVNVLNNLKIERSCLVTVYSADENIYKSAKNIPQITITPVTDLNAGEICSFHKMLFTKEALLSVLNQDKENNN